MDNESPAFWNSRPAQYGLALLSITVVVLLSLGDQPSLVFIKVAACPLFLLASRGLHLIFTSEVSRQPWNFLFFEHKLLDALLLSCWLAIVAWKPDTSLTRVAAGFCTTFVIYGGLMILYEGFFGRRDNEPTR